MPRRTASQVGSWDSSTFAVTKKMVEFQAKVEEAGGTVMFDKVRLEGAWVPQITIDLRGDERIVLKRPTFRQAIDELNELEVLR